MATTQIAERQIKDGAITNAKVAAGAAIVTTKLADGANFLKKDGTVVMTGNLDLGNGKIVNLGTPTTSTDATTKSYVDGLISGLNSLFDSKPSVRAATTTNITISNPGTASFDSVTLSNGERLFVRTQSAPAENGIYVFNGSGAALTRAADMDSWAEVPGALFAVEEGTTHADTIWLCTANQGGTLNSTAITFQAIGISSGLTDTNFVNAEVPSGSINGSNADFTIANTPTSGTLAVYLNGLRQRSGAGNDYTLTGTTITFTTAPISGDYIEVDYRK